VSLGKTFAALLCGALLLLPGCGSSDKGKPIPAAQADSLTRNIQAADQYNSDGRCQRAHTKVRDARFVLSQVPESVDADVRKGISDGLAHLDSLISSECEQQQNTQTTPTQTTQTETTQSETKSTPTETTPTQTDTTLTTTTPTTTTPTTTTPTTTTPTDTTTTGNGGTLPGQSNGAADGQG
jgi:thioester reductase-like protein